VRSHSVDCTRQKPRGNSANSLATALTGMSFYSAAIT